MILYHNVPQENVEDFIKLDINNQFAVNNWIIHNMTFINNIKSDYIICFLKNHSKTFYDEKFNLENDDNELNDFIYNNETNIKNIFNAGLKVCVLTEKDIEVLLSNNNNKVCVVNITNSNIINYDEKITDYDIVKIIEKKPKFPTVNKFMEELQYNKLLYNSEISLCLKGYKKEVIKL